MSVRAPHPTGTVTFLMTDIAGSTRIWEGNPEIAGAAIERHDALIDAAVGASGGVLIKSKGEGDSTFSVFADASAAIGAAVDVQLTLQRESWPEGGEIRVRAALYTGEAEVRDGDYHGIAPNRGGRLRATAHGGQILCSQVTQQHVARRCPPGISLRSLGLHRLRDLARAEPVGTGAPRGGDTDACRPRALLALHPPVWCRERRAHLDAQPRARSRDDDVERDRLRAPNGSTVSDRRLRLDPMARAGSWNPFGTALLYARSAASHLVE